MNTIKISPELAKVLAELLINTESRYWLTPSDKRELRAFQKFVGGIVARDFCKG